MTHLRLITPAEATGPLAAVYQSMSARPMPPTYRPAHGGPAGIIQAHSLDVELMQRVFQLLGQLERQGPADLAAARAGKRRDLTTEPVLLLNKRSRRVSACRVS